MYHTKVKGKCKGKVVPVLN